MLKYITFFLLILSIFSKQLSLTEDDKKKYYKSIYIFSSRTKPSIINNYNEIFRNWDEDINNGYHLGSQIGRSSAFEEKEKDVLEIKAFDSEDAAKTNIVKKYVVKYHIRNNGEHDLGYFFTMDMKYANDKWSKYDLLVSQKNEIMTLSVFTIKDGSKYVNVYFVTQKRVKYGYSDFILINKSENDSNCFNGFYSMEVYKYDYGLLKTIKNRYKVVSKENNPYIHKYKEVLVKYYSILSYTIIANEISEKFPNPF